MDLYEKIRNMKIAVIDDDRYLLDSMAVYFEYKGCPLRIFDNVSLAMKSFSSERYDLILCDYLMPDMDGISLLKLAGDLQPGAIRILVTAYPRREIMSLENRKAYDDLIQKPLTIANLETSFRRLLGVDQAKGSVA